MVAQNSIMHLLIAKSVARTGSTALDPAAATYLIDGEVAVLDLDGTVLDSTTVIGKPAIRIVQSQGALLPSIQSPVIEKKAVKTYKGKAYTAPALQTDYIGYNAVTNVGDIDVLNSNGYEVLIHDIGSMAYGSVGVDKFGFFVSDSTATKTEVIDGMAISLFQNTSRVVRKPFIVERVSAAVFTASTGATGNAALVNGSTSIVLSGGTPSTDFSVGMYVRIGTTATTDDTKPMYRVVGVDDTGNGTLTIDMPFQGPSATWATTGFAFALEATVLALGVGIRLTALAPVFVSPQSTNYYVNRWIPVLRNFGATTVTNTVIGTEGVGTYAAVASLEYFLLGSEGFIARNVIPYINPRANALAASTYGFITLEWDSQKTGAIFASQPDSKQLLVAFDAGNTSRQQLTGVVTSVQTVLNAWIGTTPGPFVDLALS